MDWNALVGRNLRKRRAALGLSQEDLAHKAGVSIRMVGSVERGQQSPTIEVLGKLADALEVSPASLLNP